ncbi:MAG: (2Fe-2S)-binding protein, partial [Candidatus Thermoplasmatota archaeon]|nr:(2Fe-2S)-binding protein [Candidatus Thermoplasmatota archaeon]
KGVRDFNSLKAVLRVGMGPCGGKTCIPLIERIFREEKVELKDVEPHVERPFTQEVPMKAFVSGKRRDE